jgi:hypothetical protein
LTLFSTIIRGVFICFFYFADEGRASGQPLSQPGRVSLSVPYNISESIMSVASPVASGQSAAVSGQLRFENMGYLSEVPDSPHLTRTQYLSGRIHATGVSAVPWDFGYNLDLMAGKFYSQRQTHWAVNELSASTRVIPEVQASLGRKKEDWSRLDEFWQLGLWQPKYGIDALRPEDQGLTGLFLDYDKENFRLLGFVTSISVPTLGPEVREEGGGLVSDDRWYRAPSQSFTIGKNVKAIAYRLDRSDLMRLIKHEGRGLMARLGSKTKGPWLGIAAGDKPVNDVIYTRNVVVPTGPDATIATVQPDIARHLIVSTDVGYAWGAGVFVLSALRDRPSVNLPREEWVTQRLGAIEAYSGLLTWNLGILGMPTTQVNFGYLRVYGGEIVDIESQGQAADFTLFDQRLKFTNTVSFKMQGPLVRIFGRQILGKWSYAYDWDQQGSLVGAELQLQVSREWLVLAGADLLGVENENLKPNSFLNQYRANDRIFGGLTYVF